VNSASPSRIEKLDLFPDKSVWKNYSFATCVRAGDFVFTSFQAASPEGDITRQSEECFGNLKTALALAGATLEDVVKMTILLRNVSDFQGMDDVYKTQFPNGFPARTTMFVATFIDDGARIQIDAVACVPQAQD
jgi:2-iminobutanoate/2-iminopropanoate deaminase